MSSPPDNRVGRLEDWQSEASGRLKFLERLAETSEVRLAEERKANADERKANADRLAEERKANADERKANADRLASERKWTMGIYAVMVIAVITSPFVAKILSG
ncbi:MAG: hypothetical protein ISN28_02750 [Ectothiorhodospiraceae bacterium AqS1]|nr:hypothetical protein [Ectothiorhodospiraceae bacterium AqS1]